jgi:hypothetical protein
VYALALLLLLSAPFLQVFLTVTPVTFSRHPTNDPRFLISEKRTNRQLSRLLNQKKKNNYYNYKNGFASRIEG